MELISITSNKSVLIEEVLYASSLKYPTEIFVNYQETTRIVGFIVDNCHLSEGLTKFDISYHPLLVNNSAVKQNT